jgi:MFS transporter, ACS family, 4-hydroxyphenylacetate permease
MVIFWTLPATVLSEQARPVGIALICSAGILGSALSPSIVGLLKDLSGSFAADLWYAIGMIALSIITMSVLTRRLHQRGLENTPAA